MDNRNTNNCCVDGCRNKQKDSKFSFFTLPNDSERRNEWLKEIGRSDLLNRTDLKPNSYKVCSIHFESSTMSEVLTRRKLLPGAVPTKFLPNQPQPITSICENESCRISDVSTQTRDSYIGIREADDESDDGDHLQDQDDTNEQDVKPEITQIKIEPPEAFASERDPDVLNTILGSDGGWSLGFRPFVRATNLNLPRINMFAVVEFIAGNNYYTQLDYDKLKDISSNKSKKLISGLRVQNREFVHRVRCTVHLHTSSQCGIEYDISTHTVTRSECMCACATCEHVAALLMWLHCVSNQKNFDAKLVPEDNRIHQPDTKHTKVTVANPKKNLQQKSFDTKTVKPGSRVMLKPDVDDVHSGVEDSEVSLNEPDDPLDVPELADLPSDEPGPSTAKRKKIAPPTPSKSYSATVFKTKSTPKETDTKIDESIIKCSFTRKCFFNVWRSTKGNFHEKLRHTRSIMTKAFHDSNYVIDFLPLEKRLEELCMEIEGYWSVEADREGFESKYAEWFAAVENIDLKKTKREPDAGAGSSFVAV